MHPTLLIGQTITADNIHLYRQNGLPRVGGPIERGDLLVFVVDLTGDIYHYMMRVVAMPGETVEVTNGRLYINGELVERRDLGPATAGDGYGGTAQFTLYEETLPGGLAHQIFEVSDDEFLDNTEEFAVPPGHYFVM